MPDASDVLVGLSTMGRRGAGLRTFDEAFARGTTACRLLLLATSTPSDLLLLDGVAFAAGMSVVPALADIAQAISRHLD